MSFCVIVAAGAAGLAEPQRAPASPPAHIIGVASLVHGVETLEKSLEYYRTVFGFELVGSISPTPIYDVQVQALTNHGGALYRSATLKIPDSAFTLQLFEVTNGQPGTRSSDRQTTARPTDPGSAVLSFRVPDINATLASIENSYQADVISVGGKPAGQTLFVRNRDGFVTEIVQSGHTGPSAGSNASAPSIALTAGTNAAAKIRFYREVLGFDLKTGDWETSQDLMNARGAQMGMIRRSQGFIPGTNTHFEIDEYSGMPQKRAYYYYNSIPGAVSLQLLVRDIDETVTVLRAKQVRIVTTGQQPVTIDHSRNVLVRDPDGLYVQLTELEQDKTSTH
jgi:catechol 2,3-dioxygenase-like lactoylglutathione lyase family enzyme